jgi:cell division septum initiation protein DivIVA
MTGPEVSKEELQAEIERTRAELGETVHAMASRLDVKSRATQAASEAKEQIIDRTTAVAGNVADRATDDSGRIRPAVPVALALIAATVVGVVIWRRR